MVEKIRETIDFKDFLNRLEDKEGFAKEVADLFAPQDEFIYLRVRDDKRVVYLLKIVLSVPTHNVFIELCKHAQATFTPIKGEFKLEKTLATILKEQQKEAHKILAEMNEEYLDTY